jgi:16S rRNA processing protein RimM
MSLQQSDKRICVAKIGAAHGIRGEVRLWPFTADPLAIADYGVMESADGARTFEIEAVRQARDCLIVRIKGVKDRTAAEKLCHMELYVARDRLPKIEADDEFYYDDLVGLTAVDPAGAPLGAVVAVHNFGAGDLLELKLTGLRDTMLIPFSDATVSNIDIAGGTVVVQLPDETDDSPESET